MSVFFDAYKASNTLTEAYSHTSLHDLEEQRKLEEYYRNTSGDDSWYEDAKAWTHFAESFFFLGVAVALSSYGYGQYAENATKLMQAGTAPLERSFIGTPQEKVKVETTMLGTSCQTHAGKASSEEEKRQRLSEAIAQLWQIISNCYRLKK